MATIKHCPLCLCRACVSCSTSSDCSCFECLRKRNDPSFLRHHDCPGYDQCPVFTVHYHNKPETELHEVGANTFRTQKRPRDATATPNRPPSSSCLSVVAGEALGARDVPSFSAPTNDHQTAQQKQPPATVSKPSSKTKSVNAGTTPHKKVSTRVKGPKKQKTCDPSKSRKAAESTKKFGRSSKRNAAKEARRRSARIMEEEKAEGDEGEEEEEEEEEEGEEEEEEQEEEEEDEEEDEEEESDESSDEKEDSDEYREESSSSDKHHHTSSSQRNSKRKRARINSKRRANASVDSASSDSSESDADEDSASVRTRKRLKKGERSTASNEKKSENQETNLASLSLKDLTERAFRSETGDGSEYYELGMRYLEGRDGAKKLPNRATFFLEKASVRRHPAAPFQLAQLSASEGTISDHLQKAAELGYVPAYVPYGIRVQQGKAVRKNVKTAAKYFAKAAEAKDPAGHYHLGLCAEHGEGVEPSERDAFNHYQLASDQGYAPATYRVGRFYLLGKGVVQNTAKALELINKAAESGVDEANMELAELYDKGAVEKGILSNQEEASRFYRAAASKGQPEAQYQLGLRYLQGKGVGKDEVEASRLFRLAAEKQHSLSQLELGICLRSGIGVAVNLEEAFEFLEQAAKTLPTSTAQRLVGCMLLDGEGTDVNTKKAVGFLTKAATKGDEIAQFRLGECYLQGVGCKRDLAAASQMFEKAGKQGNAKAKAALAALHNSEQAPNA